MIQVSLDDISYIDDESLIGINLWSDYNNNPLMFEDPNGTS